MTGIRELGRRAPMSAAPAQVRVSVMGGRTQLDVALPRDVSVASLLPGLVTLVGLRDGEAPADAPPAQAPQSWLVLRRVDPRVALQPDDTLRAAGVADGELLELTEQRALSVPTLYDDVVDAAARLNKAAYAGWNAAAARWMSFVGIGVASLIWAYFLVQVTPGPSRAIIVGLAGVVVAAMLGGAVLAHRWYGQADVGAAVGWSIIPISAAILWALLRGFGGYGLGAGLAALVVVNAACYWAIGTGRWGFVASSVFFAGGGLAILSHAVWGAASTAGVVWAVAAALGCLAVPHLTGRLARVQRSSVRPDEDRGEESVLQNPFAVQPESSGAEGSSAAAMPTAEEVWARARSATRTRSALYAGLGLSVVCAAASVLAAEPGVRWAAVIFAGVCALTLGVYARVPGSALERVSLGVPAVGLVVVGCVCAQRGTAAMAWAGYGTLLAVAAVVSVTGPRLTGAKQPRWWVTGWAYLQYLAFAALIPAALWVTGLYAQLEIR